MTELVLKRLGEAFTINSLLARLKSIWMLVIAIPIALAILDPAQLEPVLTKAVGALAHTLPYIVFAVLLIAYLKASGAERVIADAFKGRENRMIVFAALFGGLAPFCSCEVIPFVAGLLAAGVPIAAIMAFWLSSPLMDPAQFVITAGALGWHFAIAKTIGAVMIGLMAGFVVKAFSKSPVFADPAKPRPSSGCCKAAPGLDERGKPVWAFWHEADRREVFRFEAIESFVFLFKWLALAYMLEGLLIAYVPAESITQYVGGPGPMPVIIGALIGLPAYLNGYAAIPLVSGLVEQGMSPGAAMAFIMSGSVSCIPAMAAVYSLVKFRVFLAYAILGLIGAMLIGGVYSLTV